MKPYLIYLAQAYPNFRAPELESIAHLHGISIDVSHHDETSPFLIVHLACDEDARKLIERSVLSRAIYELWGQGNDYPALHESVRQNEALFAQYKKPSFKFDFVSYMGSRSHSERCQIVEDFKYLGFEGPIRMKNPDQVFTVLEQYQVFGMEPAKDPVHLWFGRHVADSSRAKNILDRYDLRRRPYIGTTSFDAELSLVTCNIACVSPGKIVYDPFTGTGSFLVAAAEYGGIPVGSDIDPRMLRGKGPKNNIPANFRKYGTQYIDVLTMDFTHNALRPDLVIDSIVCDPPYGVREGLKVCGASNPEKAAGRENVVIGGEKGYLRRDFIAPKKPYELSSLLADLLDFSANRLPVGGRLAFWMPTANDEYQEHLIPQHQSLELLYALEQEFSKWSRRLLVYVKRDKDYRGETTNGLAKISNFRDRYFNKFAEPNRAKRGEDIQ